MTHKQSIFVQEYLQDFNATRAAIAAGYSAKTAGAIGSENLKKPEIQEALHLALSQRTSELVADRQARQEFWTRVMYDNEQDMKHRLRASELLAKSECDFVEHKQVEANYTLADLIASR